MRDDNPDVTLDTLHGDLTAGFGQMRAGFADVKATLITGFSTLASRESAEDIVRLLRESNRVQEERIAQLDVRGREQHVATQHVLHALTESQQRIAESHERLTESHERLNDSHERLNDSHERLRQTHERLAEEQRALSREIRALIARLDAIIRGRNNGPASA